MNWPNHTDYQDAIQNPTSCFAEDKLRSATVTCDMLGMPRVMSGNFASVYEVATLEGKHYAVRCFVRQVTNQQVRYNLLAKHLQAVKLDNLIGFDFFLRGIRVHNDWYPIVTMDWVRGVPMHIYVEEHVKEPETMLRLAQQWCDMLKGLRLGEIAHGDLQHGNVMCTDDGQFRLVDYDGMYVPGFGKSRSPELGHANYQHPRRTPEYYDLNLDNFSGLVGYTSFLALAKEPDLWTKFHTGDNLIMLASDFKDPRNSPVFQRLKNSPDPHVQKLAAVLERACIWPVAQVPSFEDTLTALAKGTLPEPAPLPPAAVDAPDWLKAAPAEPTPARTAPRTPSAISTSLRPAAEMSRPSPAMSRPSPAPAAATATATTARPATPKPVTSRVSPLEPMRAPSNISMAGTRPSRATAEPLPVIPPQEESNFNMVGYAAAGLGVISFIPVLNFIGLAAIICGIFGWKGAPPKDNSRWAAVAGIAIGVITLIMAALKLLK